MPGRTGHSTIDVLSDDSLQVRRESKAVATKALDVWPTLPISIHSLLNMSHPKNLNGIIDALEHHVVPNEISNSFRKMCRPDARTISSSAMSFLSLLLAVLGQCTLCICRTARHPDSEI